jgi:hypothetical protein
MRCSAGRWLVAASCLLAGASTPGCSGAPPAQDPDAAGDAAAPTLDGPQADAMPDAAAPPDAAAAPDSAPPADGPPPDAPLPGAWCADDFDCASPETPLCVSHVCVAGPSDCTGDDANEPDDGPAAAHDLDWIWYGAVCDFPGDEKDYYRVVLGGDDVLLLDWLSPYLSMEVSIYDATGTHLLSTSGDVSPIRIDLSGQTGLRYISVGRSGGGALAWSYGLSVGPVECETPFDCPATEPTCVHLRCLPAPAECTGDDAHEPDDGPAVATDLLDTASGQICSQPQGEADYYRIAMTGAPRRLFLSSDYYPMVSATVYDSAGTVVDDTHGIYGTPILELPAITGTYYARIFRIGNVNTASSPYDLSLHEVECESSLDCSEAEPRCWKGICLNFDECSNDDANEPDDGPNAATPLAGALPISVTGRICPWLPLEGDWFQIDLDGSPLRFTLDWEDPEDPDDDPVQLDLTLYDAALNPVAGGDGYPLVIDASGLSGSHYLEVSQYQGGTLTTGYDLTVSAPPP